MGPFTLFDSAALTWFSAVSLGVLILYYYTTKTDIPKIKGIPEIPGAIPMYVNSHTSFLIEDLDI
jgi:hypothetical protein